MKVLVLGSGAREHALAAALARSPTHPEVLVAPGNDAMRDVAQVMPIPLDDLESVATAARDANVTLTVAGSEDPLVRGVWDLFDLHGMRLLGPSQAAAQIEGSKIFAKEFMRRHHIPTADFEVCSDFESAEKALSRWELPFVLKVDGLAAGKGVHIVSTASQATQLLRDMLIEGVYGAAGRHVLFERLLEGPELSVFALCDGYNYRLLGCARDYKRARDGDEGPNTGGMGAYSPVPEIGADLCRQIETQVLAPTLVGMLDEGMPYRGFLYAGLMLTASGPKVLEFNCRLGDPEAQVLLPRLRSDFAALCAAADAGDVTEASFDTTTEATVGVVVASEGYPEAPLTGRTVHGLEAARRHGATVYCAGVRSENDTLVTTGGRVVTVVGHGSDVEAARRMAYAAAAEIDIEGSFYRRDIARTTGSPVRPATS